MDEIIARTSFTDILPPGGGFTPNTPLFQFKNTGNSYMFINGNVLAPGDIFGIDHSQGMLFAMIMGKKVDVRDKTVFQISFGAVNVDPSGIYGGALLVSKGCMITTEYFFK